jgi:hypothetical protein
LNGIVLLTLYNALCFFIFNPVYQDGHLKIIKFYCHTLYLKILNIKRFCKAFFQNSLLSSSGSVLAFGTQVRGFAPRRRRRIFRAKKSSARLPSEGK